MRWAEIIHGAPKRNHIFRMKREIERMTEWLTESALSAEQSRPWFANRAERRKQEAKARESAAMKQANAFAARKLAAIRLFAIA